MRSSVRVLRWGAAILAGIGLFIVWGVARRATVPTLLARDLGHTANWAFVQVRGVVTRYPSYDEESGYLGFWIDDGSGEILITAYRGASRALVSEGALPTVGDVATVQGTVRVKQDSTALVLNAPEHLAVERPAAAEVPIAQIDEHVHQKVLVRGQVREVRTPYEGFVVLHVRDETGGVDVIYDQDLVRLSGAPVQVLPGDSVSVRGAVTRYKGQPQIALDAAGGLQRVSQEIAVAARTPIGGIGPGDKESWVRVQGAVTDIHPLSVGSKCVLSDGTGEIAIILWANVLDAVSAHVDVRPGAWLEVQGMVAEYRGELEVIPELACDVRALPPPSPPVPVTLEAFVPVSPSPSPPVPVTLEAFVPVSPLPSPPAALVTLEASVPVSPPPATLEASVPASPPPATLAASVPVSPGVGSPTVHLEATVPAPSPTATLSPLPTGTPTRPVATAVATPRQPDAATGLLTAGQVGQEVTISGRIESAMQFASGVRASVDDGTGPVVVWMPQEVYENLVDGAGWRVGSLVRVNGRVEQYKDEIEVVPHTALDVVLVDVAAPLPGSTVPLGELSAARAGEWVTVEAEVVVVEGFSKGVRAVLDDGSAQITLLLWQEVYDGVPDRERLVAGAVVRVAGEVQEYRGELEIVPGMGTDVVLIAQE